MSNETSVEVKKLQDLVLRKLRHLGAYVYHDAVNTESVYIKFEDERLRSLRISAHKGIGKYKYKWNLRLDGDTRTVMDEGTKRFFYAADDVYRMINAICNYKKAIDRNEQKEKQQ